MKHRLKIIAILIFLIINFTAYSVARGVPEEKEIMQGKQGERVEKEVVEKFRQSKKYIYSKEWEKAAAEFEKIVNAFPGSEYADDSFYWLGYSQDKMGRDLRNAEKGLEIRKQALKNLARLIARYPSSQWLDDAKRLTVEIAGELAAEGLEGFEKVVLNGFKDAQEAETKIVALIQLFDMDKEKAFSIATRIIRTSKNSKLREKVVFVLGQQGDPRVVSILVDVAEKDTDKNVRNNAVFWLGQLGTKESIIHLIKLYNSTADIELKNRLLFSISQSGHKDAVKELIRIYKKETDTELKKRIIFALGNNESKEAKEFILEILE